MCRFLVPMAALVEALLLTSPSPPRQRRRQHDPSIMSMVTPSETAGPSAATRMRDDPSNDLIADWTPPPEDVVKRVQRERIGPLRFMTSPVFFSTDARTGRRHRGLSCLPPLSRDGENRPLLFVSNHQLVGIDSWMVVSELLKERGLLPRSLVHPLIFPSSDSGGGQVLPFLVGGGRPASSDWLLRTFGAVKASPMNLYRLMEAGQPTLLYPGGARESFHGRSEEYTLKAWPDGKTDFVRIAAKFDATIVPFSSVGAAESAIFLADPPDRKKTPFGIGDAIADFIGENAPYDARYDSGEILTFPLVLPKPIPARHFFLFHKPMSTSKIHHKNRESCRKAYEEVKINIRRGINDLLLAREKDPFKHPARRMIYEQVWNRQAPTFPLEELNSF